MSCIVVTGANRGIGLELCRYFLQRGHKVYGACRIASNALRQLGSPGEHGASGLTIVEGVDVATEAGVTALRDALSNEVVDILINNAGVLEADTLEDLTYIDIRRQIEINAIGPLRVAEGLLANFRRGSKVALITSRMGSITDNSSGGYYGYRMSKAALNAAGVSLARDLGVRGVAVVLLHPGFVRTEMVGFAGDITAEMAAERLAARIDELTLESSGSFWHANGESLPW